MFGMMGNCMSWMKKRSKPGRTLTLGIFGIDNAGKTVTGRGLSGGSIDDVAPTIGFQNLEFKFDRYDITMYDLGGGKNIRPIWKNYFTEIYGCVYVVDSSAPDRIAETREVLGELLSHEKVHGKPMLVLANKQDKEGALDELDICDNLKLEEIVNDHKTPCRVEVCSATLGEGKKLDRGIRMGFQWLLDRINADYDALNERVEADMEKQKAIDALARKERLERVRKIREEREREEAEERARRGEPEPKDESEGEIEEVNPFKTLDIHAEELAKKDKKKKAEKEARNKKEKEGRISPEVTKENVKEISEETPKVDDEVKRTEQEPLNTNRNNAFDQTDFVIKRSEPSSDPFITQREPSSDRFVTKREPSSDTFVTEREPSSNLFITERSSTKSSQPRRGSPVPTQLRQTRSLDLVEDDEDVNDSFPKPRRLESLDGANSPIEPVEKKKKKKKKKIKKNQTFPVVEEDEDITSSTVPPLALQPPPNWQKPSPRNFGRLQPLERSGGDLLPKVTPRASPRPSEPVTYGSDNLTSSGMEKWGFAEDLPEASDDVPMRLLRPNADSDDIIT